MGGDVTGRVATGHLRLRGAPRTRPIGMVRHRVVRGAAADQHRIVASSRDVSIYDSRLLVVTRLLAPGGCQVALAVRELMLSATALGVFWTLALVIRAVWSQ